MSEKLNVKDVVNDHAIGGSKVNDIQSLRILYLCYVFSIFGN